MESKMITLGGATWINLANTVLMRDGQRIDLLQSRDGVLQWLKGNGLLQGGHPQDADGEAVFGTLLRLRDICADALSDLRREGRLSDRTFARLEQESDALEVTVRMVREGGVPRLIPEGRSVSDRIVYEVLRSLTDTLAHYPADRIRKCEHDSCVLHFVDTSKGGKRRWCSMELCGNRRKAADFYARKKERARM